MNQPYWNLNNLNNLGYPVISINYSEVQTGNISMKDMINVLKMTDIYFAYREVKLKNPDNIQMEKEIQEYEESKFGVTN